jgi:putative transposase
VQQANLQAVDGANPNHVAVDETVIRINDQQFWLYAVLRTADLFWWAAQEPCSCERLDLETNNILHLRLFTTTKTTSIK